MTIEETIVKSLSQKFTGKVKVAKVYGNNGICWELWIENQEFFEWYHDLDSLVSAASKLLGVTNILVIKEPSE